MKYWYSRKCSVFVCWFQAYMSAVNNRLSSQKQQRECHLKVLHVTLPVIEETRLYASLNQFNQMLRKLIHCFEALGETHAEDIFWTDLVKCSVKQMLNARVLLILEMDKTAKMLVLHILECGRAILTRHELKWHLNTHQKYLVYFKILFLISVKTVSG